VVPQIVDDSFGVSVQALVPLHVRVMQSVVAQTSGVPSHSPPPQTSPQVQGSPSSQAGAVRHCQTPPA